MADSYPPQPLMSRPASTTTGPWLDTSRPGDLRSRHSLFGPTQVGSWLPDDELKAASRASPFDACHVGVVLRALLFVHAAIGVGVLFVSASVSQWVTHTALGAALALPGVLLWLVAACALKRPLSALPPVGQWVSAVLLGALAAAFGRALMAYSGMDSWTPVGWGAPLLTGMALSGLMFYWLLLRARSQVPADTTARLAELQSRIRPHFLFNTLNTAITLARLDPARTEGLLEDLAELFRVALSESGESVSLADEVGLAQRYLAIEQIRFGDRLKVTWELDEAAGHARVPPLLLQPLVENAVRHGVEPSAEGGLVRIRTRVKRTHAVISIANTVASSPSRPGQGMALRNVRERLNLMHDVAARFDARLERDVFRVQIVVPL